MTQIQAVKIGNTVNVSIDGKLHKRNCSNKNEADAFFNAIQIAKENPTEENVHLIYCYLNERSRIALKCGLDSDLHNGNMYLAGFNTPVPNDLVEIIEDYYDNDYPMQPIVNFWSLLMINPDIRVRESLFGFIQKHDFVLTDSGYMLVYKYVKLKPFDGADEDLPEFISNSYLYIKRKWSCSPNKYMAYRDLSTGELKITKKKTGEKWDEEKKNIKKYGCVGELHANLDKLIGDKEQRYCDWYTSKMDIGIGEVIKMPRQNCDSDPAASCSFGLHVGATSYVENFASTDGAILVCLVNPANVVAVPNYDNSKMRVTEYFPIALADYDGKEIDIIDQKYFENDYTNLEEKDLEAMIKKVKAEELPVPTAIDAKPEDRDWDELQKIIEKRIIHIS